MLWSGEQVRKESLSIVMEHAVYPKGEEKPFKSSKQKNSIVRFELLKGNSATWGGLEKKDDGRWGTNLQ